MESSVGQSVLGALAVTVALAALHLAAPYIRRLPLVPEQGMGSFAGGTAVTYVFLRLLPELAAGNGAVGELLQDVVRPTPLLDLGIFAVAMALHFVLTDRGLEEHYPSRFDFRGRYVLAGGLVGGWVLGWLFAPAGTIS